MHWKDKKIWAVQQHRWANALSSLWSFVADRMIGQEKKRKFTNCPRRWTLRSYERSVEGSLQFLFHWIFIYLLLCTAHFHEHVFVISFYGSYRSKRPHNLRYCARSKSHWVVLLTTNLSGFTFRIARYCAALFLAKSIKQNVHWQLVRRIYKAKCWAVS